MVRDISTSSSFSSSECGLRSNLHLQTSIRGTVWFHCLSRPRPLSGGNGGPVSDRMVINARVPSRLSIACAFGTRHWLLTRAAHQRCVPICIFPRLSGVHCMIMAGFGGGDDDGLCPRPSLCVASSSSRPRVPPSKWLINTWWLLVSRTVLCARAVFFIRPFVVRLFCCARFHQPTIGGMRVSSTWLTWSQPKTSNFAGGLDGDDEGVNDWVMGVRIGHR